MTENPNLSRFNFILSSTSSQTHIIPSSKVNTEKPLKFVAQCYQYLRLAETFNPLTWLVSFSEFIGHRVKTIENFEIATIAKTETTYDKGIKSITKTISDSRSTITNVQTYSNSREANESKYV